MEIDFFGIKIGKEETNKNYKQKKEYEITKKQLLNALKLEEEEIGFINYDHKKGILTIKEK